ncbi:MAG TPA: tetratricopeptide repeat protein [Pyrinomonadaceae bacterium]|nr:tetratricopeptide repeat protein [Pyrinomonadaceae bacterium]
MRELALKLTVLALLGLSCAHDARAQRATVRAQDFDRVAAQAEQARSANRVEEAIKLYRRAVSMRPRWAEGWFNLGTLLYDKDAYADAAAALGRAAALSPKVGTTWVMMGLCEFKLGRHAEALEHIQRGRKLGVSANPQLRHVMIYHEGLLLVGKGDFQRAQDTLGQLSEEGVESDELFMALGLSVLRLRFSELRAGGPALREIVGRVGRAEHLAAQKKFEEAQAAYERLAADFPKGQNVQYALGRFLLTSNEDERAVAALLREIENNPQHLLARLLIADTKLRLREFAAGLPYAEEAAKLSPRLPLARYLLGSLLLGAGQTARAVAELETAARLMPGEPKIFYALSNAYLRAGRKQDAERALATFARLREQNEGGDAFGRDVTGQAEGQASRPPKP